MSKTQHHGALTVKSSSDNRKNKTNRLSNLQEEPTRSLPTLVFVSDWRLLRRPSMSPLLLVMLVTTLAAEVRGQAPFTASFYSDNNCTVTLTNWTSYTSWNRIDPCSVTTGKCVNSPFSGVVSGRYTCRDWPFPSSLTVLEYTSANCTSPSYLAWSTNAYINGSGSGVCIRGNLIINNTQVLPVYATFTCPICGVGPVQSSSTGTYTNKSSLSAGDIAGISIGCVSAVLLTLLVFFLYRQCTASVVSSPSARSGGVLSLYSLKSDEMVSGPANIVGDRVFDVHQKIRNS
jgi:hypothetical protein